MLSGNGGWLTNRIQRHSGWRLITSVLRHHRGRVLGIIVTTFGVYISGLSVPILLQHIIDGIASRQASLFNLMLGLLAIELTVLDILLADVRRSMIISLGQRIDRHISRKIMAHVLYARIDAANHNTGEILNRSEQADKIKNFIIDVIPASIFNIGGAVIATALIFFYSIYCGIAVVTILSVGALIAKKILQHHYKNVSRMFKLRSERQGNLAETVGGLATIKALAIELGRFRLWNRKTKNLINTYGATSHTMRRLVLITRLSQQTLTLVIVGISSFEMTRGTCTVGELFAILMLAAKVSTPFSTSADVARQWREVTVAVKELGHLLDTPLDRANVPEPVRTPLAGRIEFRDVIYRYNAEAAPAIAGVSLHLPATGLVAFIGRNGSGKSTLLRLLQGLLRDFEGNILVNGADVRAYDPRWLRLQMAVVNQDTILFAGTIRENLTCWTTDVTEEELHAALRLTGAWDFVNELPDKLDTHVSENASNFSGGQRQRLSIARAVVRNPKIILLDEPTAFLDAEAAVGLEARLSVWGRGRLMILVSHHLAATRAADTIILMEQGRIAGQGSHGELLASSPLYRSLWNDYLRGTEGSAIPVGCPKAVGRRQ